MNVKINQNTKGLSCVLGDQKINFAQCTLTKGPKRHIMYLK